MNLCFPWGFKKSRIISFKYFCIGRKCNEPIFWSFFEVNFIFFSLSYLFKSIQLYNIFSIFVSLAVEENICKHGGKTGYPNCSITNFINCCNMLVKELHCFNYFTSLGYLYYRSELQNLKEAWYQETKCCYKHFHHIVVLEICKSLHLKTKGCIRENKLFKQETSEELDKRWNCNSNKTEEHCKETTRSE